jgi:hypothetical protein
MKRVRETRVNQHLVPNVDAALSTLPFTAPDKNFDAPSSTHSKKTTSLI